LERLDRTLHGTVSQSCTILDEHLPAITIAQAQNGRRHEREGEAFLQGRNLLIDAGIDFSCRARTLGEWCQGQESHPAVWRIGELQGIEPRKSYRVDDVL